MGKKIDGDRTHRSILLQSFCRSVDGDLTRASHDLRSIPDLREICTNLFSRDFRSWTWCLGTCKRERADLVGGCKGEGASASLPFFPFMDWRQETLGFLSHGAWKIAGEREREERERDLRERVLYFFDLIKPIQIHVYINTGSSDPNPKLPWPTLW